MQTRHILNVIYTRLSASLPLFFFVHFFFLVGATLVDRVQILAIQEQKNNIIEAQRKTQYDARMQSAKTALAGLNTPPPSAGLVLLFMSLRFF